MITIRETGKNVGILIEALWPLAQWIKADPPVLAPHYRPPGLWCYPEPKGPPLFLCQPPCHPLEAIAALRGWAPDWETLVRDRQQSWLTGTAILADHLGLTAPTLRFMYMAFTPLNVPVLDDAAGHALTRLMEAVWSACGYKNLDFLVAWAQRGVGPVKTLEGEVEL